MTLEIPDIWIWLILKNSPKAVSDPWNYPVSVLPPIAKFAKKWCTINHHLLKNHSLFLIQYGNLSVSWWVQSIYVYCHWYIQTGLLPSLCFVLLFIYFLFASSFSCTTLLETWRGERIVLFLLEKGGVDMSRKNGNLLHAVQITQN